MSDEKKKFFTIHRSKKDIVLNTILAIGFVLVLVGIHFCVRSFFTERDFKYYCSIAVLVLGSFFLYMTFAIKRHFVFVFTGFFLVLNGVLLMICIIPFIPVTLFNLWPLILVNAGVSLILSSLYRYKKVSSRMFFPSFILICLGFIFLLFSLHILPFTFKSFISRFWAYVLIFFGILLIIIFVVQRNSKEKFPYIKEGSELEEGEEVSGK